MRRLPRRPGVPDRQAEVTIKRGLRDATARANGLFVAPVAKEAEIRVIADSVSLPLNVLAWAGLPGAAALAKLGARRLSAGSSISLLT